MYKTKKYNLVLDYFQDNPEVFVTANDLILKFSNINKSTIYRKLLSLEKDGYIVKSFNHEFKCYEYSYSKHLDDHMHLICKNCGKIIHLECDNAKGFLNHILLNHDFIIDSKTTIYGLCKECE